MTGILVGAVVGLLVGWNLPQPTFAKNLQAKFVGLFK